MSNHRIFTQEELTAYLDGEHEFAPVQEIEAALEQDSELKARLETLTIDLPQIGKGFDGLLASAPSPDFLNEVPEQRQYGNWRGFAQMAAAAAVFFTVGLTSGLFLAERNVDTWEEYVAAYQALYGTNTLAHIQQPPEMAAAELTRVSAAVRKNIDLATIKGVGTLDYKRAQILTYEGRPLIQLTFLSETGTPIALCIVLHDGLKEADVTISKMEGMRSASWAKDGYGYLLIGGDDEELIEKTAEYYSERI